MKTILVIQKDLPSYRDFLWEGLRKKFKLFLAEASTNRLFLPDGSVRPFREYCFENKLDCLILNAGIREFFKTLRYIKKYRALKVLGWTQFVGKNKSLLSRIVKSIYLMSFFDRVMLYYEHEKGLVPFKSLRNKCIGLNNTIADWQFSIPTNINPRVMVFLGRYTEKSKLDMLLDAALIIEGIEVHVIGVEMDGLPERFRTKNLHFHGNIDDLTRIQDMVGSCAYFVYPGDVGLSIVHAVKLGLIPVVHADLDAHMPECRAVAQNIPVMYFQKDDRIGFYNMLSLLVETKPTAKTKEWIASRGRKLFAAEGMVSKFVKTIEGV